MLKHVFLNLKHHARTRTNKQTATTKEHSNTIPISNWLRNVRKCIHFSNQLDIFSGMIQASFTIMRSSYKWKILAGHWTIKLGRQTAGCNKSFQSLVFVLTQLHFGQWTRLLFLTAKFDCPVTRQNVSLLATAHDCETGLLSVIWPVIVTGLFVLRSPWTTWRLAVRTSRNSRETSR